MTPFGEKLRLLRKSKNVSQKNMAAALNVSPAYLSALEHGHRGKPQWSIVQRIITYFNIIWDDAEELQYLASISDPKTKLNTAELSANATKLTNMLAGNIARLTENDISSFISQLELILDRNFQSE
ncbi:MAG: helix-turn-helix transcriptional regulator [Hyphomicrobiales bacterium]|nr:helix-turn-helix transcriptional regulator [Hyphomicrobiales bacterium]